MSEYWDVLDCEGNKTGRQIRRDKFNNLPSGQYHLVAHIWITNSKGELLIQQRSFTKHPMPGEWAATSGSVLSGEDSKTAAIRELKEETGILIKPDEITFVKRLTRRNSFSDIWHVKLDADISTLQLQEEEVHKVMWISAKDLKTMIKNGTFHNYGADYFNIVFSLVNL